MWQNSESTLMGRVARGLAMQSIQGKTQEPVWKSAWHITGVAFTTPDEIWILTIEHWWQVHLVRRQPNSMTWKLNNTLIFLNYCSCTALPALSALRQTHACSNSDASSSTAKLMAFALSLISVLISGTTSPRMSDTLILSLPSKSNSRHFSSLSISTEYYCPSPQQSV